MKVTVIPARQREEGIKKTKLRTCAYCRVSTNFESQDTSILNQVEYYYNLITKDNELSYVDTYIDHGKSGTNTYTRSAFMQMIEDCKAGKIDRIMTKSISRFARNTLDSLKYVRMLKKLGINVYFEKENINSMDARSEFVFTVLSSLAEEESRSISTNLKWSFKKKFEKGEPMFPYTKFLGYNVVNKKVVIASKEAKIIKEIYHRYIGGQSTKEIADKMMQKSYLTGNKNKKWNVNYILNIIRNEKYMGDLLLGKTYNDNLYEKRRYQNDGRYDRYYLKDNHTPIVSKAIWYAAQYEELVRKSIKYNRIINNGEKICWSGKLKDDKGNNLHRIFEKRKNSKKAVWLSQNIKIEEAKLKRIIVKAYNQMEIKKQQDISVDISLTDVGKKKMAYGKKSLENYVTKVMRKHQGIRLYDDNLFIIILSQIVVLDKEIIITFRNGQKIRRAYDE
jgi:DNA invertase Pin-like site-specific DNA recombinase